MKIIRVLFPLILIGLLTVPILLLPPRLQPELQIEPLWSKDASSLERSPMASGDAWIPLLLDSELMFIHESGDAGIREQGDYWLQYGQDWYTNTSRFHNQIHVRNPQGDILRSFDSGGFPLAYDGRLLAVRADGLGIELLAESGEPLFSRRFAAPVSDAMLVPGGDEALVFLGLLDGRWFLLDGRGEALLEGAGTGNSRYSILYAVQTLRIAGFDPDRDLLLLVRVEGYEPAFLSVAAVSIGDEGIELLDEVSVPLDFQPLEKTVVQIVSDEDAAVPLFRIFLDTENSLAEYTLTIDEAVSLVHRTDLPSPGFMRYMDLGRYGEAYWFASGSGGQILIETDGGAIALSRMIPVHSELQFRGNRLYLRTPSRLSAYQLGEG